jgi:hypothetical protein
MSRSAQCNMVDTYSSGAVLYSVQYHIHGTGVLEYIVLEYTGVQLYSEYSKALKYIVHCTQPLVQLSLHIYLQ